MEKNFEHNEICADMAGWESLEYIDSHNIISNLPFNKRVVVQTASNTDFSTIQTESINVEVSEEDHGFSVKVEAVYKGQGTEDGQDIYNLAKGKVALRLTDLNGQRWLLGTKETPLSAKIVDNRESEADGFIGYTVTFSGKTWWPLKKIV